MTAVLSGLGPFFEVDFHAGGATPGAGWRLLDEVLDDGPVLRDRIARVRHVLATGGGQRDDEVELRVAASVAHLGLAARLCSPVLAMAAGSGVVLDLEDSWWQPVVGGPVPLSVPPPRPAGGALAEAVFESLVEGPLRRLDGAMAHFSVPAQVRWGNVASALNGAVTMLAATRPDLAGRVRAITAALYDRAPLRGMSGVVDGRFRRRNCCLIYRAAPGRGGPKCGDCVLTD